VLRLLFGMTKGVVVGCLVGLGMVALGQGTPVAWLAYAAAAAVAVLVAPIAGKKLWEKDGAIQFGLKAVAGLVLGPGLMWVVRRFGVLPLPDPTTLPGADAVPGLTALRGVPLTFGGFAVTSLALVAALLAGFYDLDNTPANGGSSPKPPVGRNKRIDPEVAALTGLDESELDAADDAPRRKTRG